jgi:integrase
VTVIGPKRVELRDPGLTDTEAKKILRATLKAVPDGVSPERALAHRWVPWLCAYTGARVNEMTQLRREDVYEVEGIWVLHVTPEAGSTKDGKARDVPVHSHLVEQGFLEVVKRARPGPLFYDPTRHRGGTEGNPQSKKVGEALARWVRAIGVKDRNVQPNHGWRHRYKTDCRLAGIDPETRDAIQGHRPRTEGEKYGRVPIPVRARAVEKLPRYEPEKD